jgi:hypothetical protein
MDDFLDDPSLDQLLLSQDPKLREKMKERLGEAILAEEATTGQVSPLRKVVSDEPVNGVDTPAGFPEAAIDLPPNPNRVQLTVRPDSGLAGGKPTPYDLGAGSSGEGLGSNPDQGAPTLPAIDYGDSRTAPNAADTPPPANVPSAPPTAIGEATPPTSEEPPLDDLQYPGAVPKQPLPPEMENSQVSDVEQLGIELDRLKQAARPVGQFAKSALQSGSALYDVPAAVLALPAIGLKKLGDPRLERSVQDLIRLGQQQREASARLIPVGEPQGPIEQIMSTAGSSVVPYKQYTLPLTAGLTTFRELLDPTVASARTPKKAEPHQGYRTDIYGPLPAEKTETIQQRKTRELMEQTPTIPSVTHTVDTVGGPANVSENELYTMGGLAAATLGAVFAPTLFRSFKLGRVIPLRPVENAAPGTMALSTAGDLARTYDDVNSGVMRLAARAGLHPQVLDRLDKVFKIQTRTAARHLTESAVKHGRMETPSFTFQSRVPLLELSRHDAPHVRDYLHARDTFDDLQLVKQQPGANPGPPVVRGRTTADALAEINAIQRAHPEVDNIAAAFRDVEKNVRKFEASGQYATLEKKEERFLNASRPNYVPFRGERVMGEDIDRGSPFVNLGEDMQYRLRHRMENEAVGTYIDSMNQVQPGLFKRVTSADLKENPHWRQNTVIMYRRGKPEYYTTDPYIADVLKMDPYYFTGLGAQSIFISKRMLEAGSTGMLAPWFAPTSMLRNWQIGRMLARGDRKAAGLLRSVAAIPAQLYPQLANAIGSSLERGSNGWLGQALGQGNVQAISQRLASVYDNSIYATLETMGTHRGSIMEQQTYAASLAKLQQAIDTAAPPVSALLSGYKNLLSAIHNAPSYAYVQRNLGKLPLQELTAEARSLTGDPRVGGQYRTGSRGKPIRFETDDRFQAALAKMAKGWGVATEIGREAIPWFNPTMQGIKAVGRGYLENPARFVGRAWLYYEAPAASMYLWARSLDKDPNGQSYTDYMMNRRSEYAKTMYWYLALPGRPAEDGIEIPRFHELAPAARMMEVALDHMLRSSIFKESEDFQAAAKSFLDVAIMPPIPPSINVAFATQGIVGPQGIYGGEAYKKYQEPFDQTGGFSGALETLSRALAGGIADVAGSFYAAATQTPGSAWAAFANGMKEAARAVGSKTAVLRDVLGLKRQTGNNLISEELFKKERAIDQLVKYYGKWTTKEGQINVKPMSVGGGELAKKATGRLPLPNEVAGLNQPPPTNPLYTEFMKEVYNKFRDDAPFGKTGNELGGIGFRSMWRMYGDATENVRRLRNINAGNYVTWQAQLEQRPQMLKLLNDNNINPKDIREVRNFFERYRQDVARTLLFTIRKVEADITAKVGRPVKIEDLDPYGKGISIRPDTTIDIIPSTF